ncbi:MAG TPA: OmpA family protein [Polyangiales bacterium]|nr:OmpA family protein [Polyangiales bacterium]
MSRRLLSALALTLGVGCASVPKGAPGGDTDADGISDSKDECPDTAEERGGDGDGCPDAPRIAIEDGMIEIHGKIVFALGSAQLAPQNGTLLELLASLINDNDGIKHVLVEGHTDTTGEESFNKQLSLERAQTVVAALTERGVKSERLSAKGMGTSQPRASNSTPAGRARNRRVEFRVLD